MEIQVQGLLEDTWRRSTNSDNLVPLLVGAAIVMIGGGLTLGILLPALMLGFVKMCFRVAADEPIEIGQITEGLSSFFPALIVGLLLFAAVIVTSCTVVGPIAIVFVSMFAFQFLARDQSFGAIEVVKASFELVKANLSAAGTVFAIGFAISAVLGGGTGILGIPAFAFSTLLTTMLFSRLTAEAQD